MTDTNIYATVAKLIRAVESNEDRQTSARLAASFVKNALCDLEEGDIDGFLANVKLAGECANETRYGTYRQGKEGR